MIPINIIVTGANGFLGQHFIKFIKSINGNILTIGRAPSKDKCNDFININVVYTSTKKP